MAEIQIIRTKTVVVDSVGKNEYEDLTFIDKDGNNYKISNKRAKWFSDKIISGNSVQLNYANAYGKEYIYSADIVKSDHPEVVKPPPNAPESKTSTPKQETRQVIPESQDRQSSIEVQNANSNVPSLVNCILSMNDHQLIKKDDPLIELAINLLRADMNYEITKLARYYSQGQPEPEPENPPSGVKEHLEEMITQEQRVLITKIIKEKQYSAQAVVALTLSIFNKSASKDLTKEEAEKLIVELKSGKKLTKEVPF